MAKKKKPATPIQSDFSKATKSVKGTQKLGYSYDTDKKSQNISKQRGNRLQTHNVKEKEQKAVDSKTKIQHINSVGYVKHQRTQLQKDFYKELTRIKRGVKRGEAKGYTFDTDVIPKIPKKITQQSLNKLQNYKTKNIYNHASKFDTNTGKVISGQLARKIEKKQATQKAQETRRINLEIKAQERAEREAQFSPRKQYKDWVESKRHEPEPEPEVAKDYTQNLAQIDGQLIDLDTGEILKTETQEPAQRLGEVDGNVVDLDTGEIVRKLHDREKYNKNKGIKKNKSDVPQTVTDYPVFSDTVIHTYKSYIEGFPKTISDKLTSWLDRIISSCGVTRVAQMLENSSARLGDYLSRVGYDSDSAVVEYCTDMLSYMPEMSDDERQDLDDEFDGEEGGWTEGEWNE